MQIGKYDIDEIDLAFGAIILVIIASLIGFGYMGYVENGDPTSVIIEIMRVIVE